MYYPAAVGIVAYPGQGIYQSIRTLVRSGARNQIKLARRQEGEYLVANPGNLHLDIPFIMDTFGRLSQKDQERVPSPVDR